MANPSSVPEELILVLFLFSQGRGEFPQWRWHHCRTFLNFNYNSVIVIIRNNASIRVDYQGQLGFPANLLLFCIDRIILPSTGRRLEAAVPWSRRRGRAW